MKKIIALTLIISIISATSINSYAVRLEEPGAIMLEGPVERVYDNSKVRFAAALIIGLVSTKVPVKINPEVVATVAAYLGWVVTENPTSDTYVKTWRWAKYSDYSKCYIEYITIVHYSNDSFDKPIKVQYFETKRHLTKDTLY